jgi:hypothetical protein
MGYAKLWEKIWTHEGLRKKIGTHEGPIVLKKRDEHIKTHKKKKNENDKMIAMPQNKRSIV